MTSEFILRITNLLDKNNVVYLITGGCSMVLRGKKAITFDLDILPFYNNKNIKSLNNFLVELGIQNTDLTENLENNLITRINTFPFPIDIMPSLDGLRTGNVFKNSDYFEFKGKMIRLISEKDLLTNYKSFNNGTNC